ncbi:MAG TPA: N-acetyl-gamma-glutamyl-phosphate reductase [Bacillota bacterium]|nr:N-acetyl-gamma-glutamyl-phosphate reductase [Bacillota bacterium]HOB28803.1 N-acetyl-gamma-glutamyl-phosphate reductase [Bacillota bacterium]HPZ42159.1 N-acetyl-gamma-glutamyl-phosphate reductase [Bacillota bacterium]HQD53095.1 N-acetyl-gamma-glutamyl-phosphate reductase [Bacillota bacterium]
MKVAVLGATGYAGCELVRLLHQHPRAEIEYIGSRSHVGTTYHLVHPQFFRAFGLELQPPDLNLIPDPVELVFCALPHGRSADLVPDLLAAGKRVIDLSADFRLRNPALYETWYGRVHPAPDLLSKAIYGLPEVNREVLPGAALVANPGCYPTSVLLALAPLANAGWIDWDSVVIDAKSGVSGAGRSPRQAFHFPECTESVKAYRVGDHQHIPEIEQLLSHLSSEAVTITFTPHLVPMIRGILSTIYLRLRQNCNPGQIDQLYEQFYDGHPFVRLLPPPQLPETRFVRGSNFCDLGWRFDQRTGRLVILSAIDNLVKGAAGQAVQNMNLLFGLPEETGLTQLPLF